MIVESIDELLMNLVMWDPRECMLVLTSVPQNDHTGTPHTEQDVVLLVLRYHEDDRFRAYSGYDPVQTVDTHGIRQSSVSM